MAWSRLQGATRTELHQISVLCARCCAIDFQQVAAQATCGRWD